MKNNNTENFKCRICDGDTMFIQTEFRNKNNYNVVQCRNCKTVQTIEHIQEISPDYVNLTQELISEAHIVMSREHKQAAYEQFSKLFEKLIKSKKNINIVDIGCGTGGFGEYINKNNGCTYFGFDASLAQVNFAKKQGLNVENAITCIEYVSKGIIERDQVNIVTMWDVLEHIRNPREFLAEIKNLMHQNTHLFISIPNGGALYWKRTIYKLFGKDFSFDPWEHVFFYNLNSIEKILRECGFDVIEGGSVVCYPRKLDFKEMIRRSFFKILSVFPSISPQIYVIAKVSNRS